MANAKRVFPPPISDEEEARIQAGIALDPDNPELTEEEFARMRPAREVLPPALYAALVKHREEVAAAAKRPTKVQLTLRLDPRAVAAWKASGPGWQTRIGEVIAREAPKAKKSA